MNNPKLIYVSEKTGKKYTMNKDDTAIDLDNPIVHDLSGYFRLGRNDIFTIYELNTDSDLRPDEDDEL